MNKLKFNPSNKKYYSEEFIKGFECGVERQFNADMEEKTTINHEKTTITDGDLISRDFMKEMGATCIAKRSKTGELVAISSIDNLPKQRTGYCKNCKYFEYDSVAKVDGIPLIVAHEICKKWGDGCKTKEDGYCFLFEPKESEDKE